jgi:predicted transcriptional regulator
MEVRLTREQEASIMDIASRTGRNVGDLLQEAVRQVIEYDEWFRKEVQSGLDQADRGDLIEHDQVLAWMRSRETS